MTVPADPRKLADTVREARHLVRLMDDPHTYDKEIAANGPRIIDALLSIAESYDELHALAEQLQQERDEARLALERGDQLLSQAGREIERERAACESAERERDEFKASFMRENEDALDYQVKLLNAEAALRAAQARAEELEKALQEARDWIAEDDPGDADTGGFHASLMTRLDAVLAASPQAGEEATT